MRRTATFTGIRSANVFSIGQVNEIARDFVVIDMSINRLMLRFKYERSDTLLMERVQIILRIVVTLILLTSLVDLAQSVGARVALCTAPTHDFTASSTVQSRRTVMDRIAQGRFLLESDPIRAESILSQVVRDARDSEMRMRAATLLVRLGEHAWPADHRRNFLSTIAATALESGRRHTIPPSVIMAQAALESGWGRSALARHHNNIFGIKAGKPHRSIELNTLEFGRKGAHIVPASFRVFGSIEESIHHPGRLLSTDKRYAATQTVGGNWRAFVAQLAPIYASDPAYAARLTQIIERYKLDRWDHIIHRGNAHVQA